MLKALKAALPIIAESFSCTRFHQKTELRVRDNLTGEESRQSMQFYFFIPKSIMTFVVEFFLNDLVLVGKK